MTDEKNEAAGESIAFECELPDAPEKVWRALTEPALLAAWLMPNDFRPELGADFTFRPPPGVDVEAPIACKVLAIEPPRLLRFSWREAQGAGPDSEPSDASSVTFVLTRREHGGTLLKLVHRGVAEAPHVGKLLRFPSSVRGSGGTAPESMRCAA
jgi:uncharacterized protein YndB with AHSA1/START domain